MTFAKIIALIGLLAMGIALLYGFGAGTLSQDGSALVKMPWGIVSLVDVYTGFVLFSGWILYRERNLWTALVLVILVMVLGNFITSTYTLWALLKSRGDWKKFWLGARI
jgi:hypothetical protein